MGGEKGASNSSSLRCTFYQGELTLTNWLLNHTFWYKTIFNWLVGILGRFLVTSYCQTPQKKSVDEISGYMKEICFYLTFIELGWTERERRERAILTCWMWRRARKWRRMSFCNYISHLPVWHKESSQSSPVFFQSIVFLLLEFTGLVRFISVRMSSILTGSDPSYVL